MEAIGPSQVQNVSVADVHDMGVVMLGDDGEGDGDGDDDGGDAGG